MKKEKGDKAVIQVSKALVQVLACFTVPKQGLGLCNSDRSETMLRTLSMLIPTCTTHYISLRAVLHVLMSKGCASCNYRFPLGRAEGFG